MKLGRILKKTKKNKNIVLIGMMGAGKSFIAAALHDVLDDFNLVDIDFEIEKKLGLDISQIFEQHGEAFFRSIESTMIKKFALNTAQIIALGGGAFEGAENRLILGERSIVFYLKSDAKELYERIKLQSNRPLLHTSNPFDTLQALLEKREQNYQKAHFTIDTSNKPAYQIVKEILEKC